MLTAKTIIHDVQQHARELRNFGVIRLSLFGSYARDEAREDSDVDFLVEFAPGRGGYRDYVGALELLEALCGTRVDLVKRHLVRDELRDEILGGTQVEAQI